LTESDIISIHAPLNDNTFNLIDLPKLKTMKQDAILINAGRGNIVNEADLAYALDHNLIAGAALDVLDREPIDPNNPLLNLKNNDKLLITPHIAWASVEARETLIDMVCENIRVFKASN
jgi:glycerate dehydrogenase